ncbi:MAG: EAL domain-containing protein [Boseongicola sp.]|nr:MAG: EAL domain-containing protein [Boseongicola sp.]
MGCLWFFGESTTIAITACLPIIGLIMVNAINLVNLRDDVDVTTGFSNASATANWLEQKALHQGVAAQNVAVLAISVDGLGLLEDRVSGPIQDAILTDLAKRLQDMVRQGDLITRGKRSDFLICVADIAPPRNEGLLQMAQRIQASLDTPFSNGSVQVYCTVSIGIVRRGQMENPTPNELIRACEAAEASAREVGPGAIRMHKSSFAQVPRSDMDLVHQIASALENGEIVAWYQPQVSTETGEISGFEALARWEHPDRGLISPATFLSLVEKSGLSQRLAEIVLTHALSALRAWDTSGLNIPSVAVNFATEELRNPRLPDFLNWELDRHNIKASRLGVEVLENVIAESHDAMVARNLRTLASMNCRIDLDDFGTGFTSILNIRRFSVSRIKIDRRLISRLDCDRDQRDLVAALLAMAERLGIETLGEGVETPAEHAMLAQLGCDHIQGYCLARPMPLGDTLAWISNHRANVSAQNSFQLPLPTKNRAP